MMFRHCNGRFLLHNAYGEYVPGEVVPSGGHSSQEEMQYGISVELARELWIHDEEDEHRWGVDFAAAFSYFFQRDVYRAGGAMSRTDVVREGDVQTRVNDPDATYFYDEFGQSPSGGMYGYGNSDVLAGGPALRFSGIGVPQDTYADSPRTAVRGFSASGDYQELEMLFMFRPWYELTDWWRVFAEVGLGVSWGTIERSSWGFRVMLGYSF